MVGCCCWNTDRRGGTSREHDADGQCSGGGVPVRPDQLGDAGDCDSHRAVRHGRRELDGPRDRQREPPGPGRPGRGSPAGGSRPAPVPRSSGPTGTVPAGHPGSVGSGAPASPGQGHWLDQDPRSGTFFTTSSDGQSLYRVGWYDCECAAGQGGDPVCLHRALFRKHCREDDRCVARNLAGAVDEQPAFSLYRERTVCPVCGGPAWSELVNGGAVGTILRYDCTACRAAALSTPSPERGAAVPAVELDDEPIGLTDEELVALIDSEHVFTIAADVPRAVALAMLDALVDAHHGVAGGPAECRDCLGTGYQRMSTGGQLNQWVPVICGCQRAAA